MRRIPADRYLTTLFGAVLNLVLDPVFNLRLHMGVACGAGDGVKPAVSCIWVLCFLTGKKGAASMQRRNLRIDGSWRRDHALAMSGFIMQGTNCLCRWCAMRRFKIYGGDLYVGVMTVINSAREDPVPAVSGITNGAQPYWI